MIGRRIGFVGLGTMGGPMAGHLAAAGADLRVWNRSSEKAAGFASVAPSLAALAEDRDVVAMCVGRTEDAEECVLAMLASAPPGMLIVDHSTIEPDGARRIAARAVERGVRYVDAPVTGGSMGAKNGTLTVFLGGSVADCEEAKGVTSPYTKRAERLGEVGAGQTAKLANQIAGSGVVVALAESLAFAEAAGLDLELVRSLVAGGAGGSWAYDNYGPKMLNGDHAPGFSVKNQRKDLAYVLAAAREMDLRLSGTETTDALLAELSAAGREEEATTALFDVARGRV